MFNKKLYFALIALLVISNVVCGKKSKKNKRPKDQEEQTTIQPNVVAYSTFGFNDVGAYDGFIPTSPDYANFLSGVNQESTTRLYAPAFPSSIDSTGYSGNYGPQAFDGHSYSVNEDNAGQAGMFHYAPNSMNIFNSPNYGTTAEQNKNTESEDTNGQNTDDSDAPVYGTKINSRHKYRAINQFNNSEVNAFNSGYSNLSDDKYLHFPEADSTHDKKPAFIESSGSFQNTNSFVQNYEPTENEDFRKPFSSNVHNVIKFPKVVDFTKLHPYYPNELDTSKILTADSYQPLSSQNSMGSTQMDNTFSNSFNYNNNNNNKFIDSSPKLVDNYNMKNNEDSADKSVVKQNAFFEYGGTDNHVNTRHKNSAHNTKPSEQKKKIKPKPWSSGNYSNDFKDWKDSSSIKGYGYSTNFSNMNFRYDVSEPKKPFNHDEIEPAGSNLVDLTSYQFPESDYSNFKKMPDFNEDDDYNSVSLKDKLKTNEYLNQFKHSFSTVPTTTSYWGNAFKSSDYSSFRDHPKKTHYGDINTDSVVNIPKRPHKLSYPKPTEGKVGDWPHQHSRPHKHNKQPNDWTLNLDTRFKSEEDLLGLRTHDTSHPTYLPTFKPSSSIYDNDNEFKNLVEKWRQSYLKTKYKDVPVRDYESYGSEVKPTHVPIPKPYPIEVPHPVIVPVPRPFPVRVPVSRPVAVPVLREITVPIVKPVPYPVYKKVPYPVEKLVPVPVEKEVTVPVEKPYPVHIPYVRPVFHHTKPVHEDPENLEEDDYMRRPEVKKPSQYKKRPYGSRNRSRRPSRSSYQERNRRRWPERRRPSSNSEHRHHSRPSEYYSPPYKHHNYEPEDEDEHSDYALYCRRTGNC
nr:homeobox protein 2 isoform X1 [Helicoverpa armigera]